MRSKLKELMEQHGVNQKTLAAETGLSPTTVGKLYNSHFSRIDNHTLAALLKRFKLKSLDELIEVVWEEDDSKL